MTYRTDLFKKAGITKLPNSLAVFTTDAKKLAAKNAKVKGFSPVYSAGTDWYFAMAFVYDYGGTIAKTHAGKWVGALDSKQSVAGLTAFKNFFHATSKAAGDLGRAQPVPVHVFSQGQAGAIIGPGWFSCCVGKNYTAVTAQFVMPSHTAGQPMPGFLGGSDLAVPAQSANKSAGDRVDRRLHEHGEREGARRRRATSRTRPTCSGTSVNERAAHAAGSCPRRSTGSTSRTAISSATCWRRSSRAS